MSGDESSDASSSPAPETLVAGRAKRTTAGNRLSHLLQHLEDEDVKADLLAEEEDDQKDYSASEDGDADVALDSSDDSEDDRKPVDNDELAGEKELKRLERVESKKKRKARELVRVQPLKKKVKIAERLPADVVRSDERRARRQSGPVRQSSRTQTVASAKNTEARIKENRKRAVKTQEMMRLAAEKRAAEAEPKLTQADRMARALKIEEENSKSLNRWEKAEQERLKAQQEKLEAMRNRKLDGPVIRYWSGPVKWIWREGPDGPVYARLRYLRKGKNKVEVLEDDAPPKGKPRPSQDAARDSAQLAKTEETSHGLVTTNLQQAADKSNQMQPAGLNAGVSEVKSDKSKVDTKPEPGPMTADSGGNGFLDRIQFYATTDATHSKPTITISPADDHTLVQTSTTTYPLPSMPPYHHIPTYPSSSPTHSSSNHSNLPLHSALATRILITLTSFPDLPDTPPTTRRTTHSTSSSGTTTTTGHPADPTLTALLLPSAHPTFTPDQRRYLTTRARSSRTSHANSNSSSSGGGDILPHPPHRPTCPVSGRPARFRDPRTSLPYADVTTHKAIQRVLAQGCAYSPLLGAWSGIVGEGSLGRTARGVPEGFWRGEARREVIELN